MTYLFLHGRSLFILAFFSLLGLLLGRKASVKICIILLITALILIAPLLAGYQYRFFDALPFLLLATLTTGYALFSKLLQRKWLQWVVASLSSIVLIIILGNLAFMTVMGPYYTTRQSWVVNGYKIDHVVHDSFSAGVSHTYELHQIAAIPVLMKTKEVVRMKKDTTCVVNFKKSKLVFDKCGGTISSINKR